MIKWVPQIFNFSNLILCDQITTLVETV